MPDQPWQFASAIDIGDRGQQQDRIGILHSVDQSRHLLVLADGMGGHEDGADAAQTVLDIASQEFSRGNIDDPVEFLQRVCLLAHHAVADMAESRVAAPGSTCIILYLTDTEAYWVHVGDSRLYQIQNGDIRYHTIDHSLAQLMLDQDGESRSGIPQNQLYMCLGGNNEVNPESGFSRVSDGDLFLLCSDGLWGQTDLQKLFAEQWKDSIDQQFADRLVQIARRQGGGSSDNIALLWAYRPRKVRWGLLRRLLSWFRR